ncbi:DegT/DnrJ/EryC1/StrS family aminotransferase [Parvibaculum lavamentivorans]|nr:DegT/DnrJ/EryC1/StrS family aminotransferase [Parvibaculum lavamentivorans]
MSKAITNVPFFRHELRAGDAERVAAVLETPFLTSGHVGQSVETQLCEYFGSKHALLTNSWTNGAVATFLALGIGPGDEVIVPAMTFVATANAAELVGATPVFVDVDPDTLLMMPELVEAALTRMTRAIVPVHLYGQMVDMPALSTICRCQDRKVWLLEDAAHCFEGKSGGYRPGAFSDAALFSFYATKNVTCGEGGAIVTDNTELFDGVQRTRNHGMSKGAIDRFRDGRYDSWDMEVLGMKANLPDVLAALLPPQIETVDLRLPQRQLVADRYRKAFSDGPLRLVKETPDSVSAEHLFTIGIPNGRRNEAIKMLNERGVGCTVNYEAVTSMTYYKRKYGFEALTFPNSTKWGTETLSLPLYPSIGEEDQNYVIDVVRNELYPLAIGGSSTR